RHARKLKERLEKLFKEKCKCPMSEDALKELYKERDTEFSKEQVALDADQKKYDDETNHGLKSAEQKNWNKDNAKALGQPEPEEDCSKCKEANKAREEQLKKLEGELKPLNKEDVGLLESQNQVEHDLNTAKAEQISAQADAAANKKGAKAKATSAQTKVTGLETKLAGIKTKLKSNAEKEQKIQDEIEKQGDPKKCPDH